MKRFFCTTCNKIKRVRVLPSDIDNPTQKFVALRKGTCRWHDSYQTRVELNSRVKL